mgnify:CR=1 FL=1
MIKRTQQVLFLSSSLLLTHVAPSTASTGEETFNQLCLSCHVKQGKATIAPPLFGVVNHVKNVYPDREAFIQRVVDWVESPNADQALMPGAVKKFGLMPKLAYPSSQVRKAAEYLYDADINPPSWYKEHYKKEHGKNPKLK